MTKTRQTPNGTLRHSIGGISNKYMKMADLYRHFGKEWAHVLDFSNFMMLEHFNHISYGSELSPENGFSVGEAWMDVNVAMWNEDISRGHLSRIELYSDLNYPHWWLDKVLK